MPSHNNYPASIPVLSTGERIFFNAILCAIVAVEVSMWPLRKVAQAVRR